MPRTAAQLAACARARAHTHTHTHTHTTHTDPDPDPDGFPSARGAQFGFRQVQINMTGPIFQLRKPLFKHIREQTGLRVMKLRHIDHMPHGGTRPRKSRRRRYRTKQRRAMS